MWAYWRCPKLRLPHPLSCSLPSYFVSTMSNLRGRRHQQFLKTQSFKTLVNSAVKEQSFIPMCGDWQLLNCMCMLWNLSAPLSYRLEKDSSILGTKSEKSPSKSCTHPSNDFPTGPKRQKVTNYHTFLRIKASHDMVECCGMWCGLGVGGHPAWNKWT